MLGRILPQMLIHGTLFTDNESTNTKGVFWVTQKSCPKFSACTISVSQKVDPVYVLNFTTSEHQKLLYTIQKRLASWKYNRFLCMSCECVNSVTHCHFGLFKFLFISLPWLQQRGKGWQQNAQSQNIQCNVCVESPGLGLQCACLTSRTLSFFVNIISSSLSLTSS